jgi:type II secretory pathway pseudopilin PulG
MQTLANWQSHRQQPKRIPGFTGIELLAAIASALFVFLLGMPIFNSLTNDGET